MVKPNNARGLNGRFAKGQSGNPGGRPRDEQKVAELARSYTREAIETLVELMRRGNDERVRGTAAQALLDRGWGKPELIHALLICLGLPGTRAPRPHAPTGSNGVVGLSCRCTCPR